MKLRSIKTGLKTLAVAIPLAITPSKTIAQNSIKMEQTKKAATELYDTFGGRLNVRSSLGYGRTPVLHSPTTAYGEFGVHFDAALGRGAAYQDVSAKFGKGGTHGRYEIGYSEVTKKGLKWNVGGYASNDFGAKEFVPINDMNNIKSGLHPKKQGLLQLGITAGAEQPINKNLSVYAKGDLGGASYSYTNECVQPVSTKIIDGVEKKVLSDKYDYEKGVRSLVAGIESGVKVKAGRNFDITGYGGVNTYQGANAGVKASANFDVFKFGRYKKQ